jgi:hypothetical protein
LVRHELILIVLKRLFGFSSDFAGKRLVTANSFIHHQSNRDLSRTIVLLRA